MIDVPPHPGRRLCWNGLSLQLADGWQASVRGHRHLLIEQDFQPLVEIRWEKNEGRPMAAVLPEICRKLSAAHGARVIELEPPSPSLGATNDRNRLAWLGRANTTSPEVLLWLSPSGQTLALLHLAGLSPAAPACLPALLTSLCDSATDPAIGEWRVQDISFQPPPTFVLEDFRMAAGLTSIGFNEAGSTLIYYRLAPAKEHLRQNTLPAILARLDQPSSQRQGCCETPDSCERQVVPIGFSARLMARLTRRQAYRWSRIWHLPSANRLLAVVLTSKKPIPAELPDSLCRHYAIQTS